MGPLSRGYGNTIVSQASGHALAGKQPAKYGKCPSNNITILHANFGALEILIAIYQRRLRVGGGGGGGGGGAKLVK